MSEVNATTNVVNPATANATEGLVQETEVVSASSSESVNARLLRESQDYKRKFQELKAKQDDEAKNKLIESGNLKEALEMERKQAAEWKRNAMKFRIEAAIEGAASRAGCVNPKALIKLGNLGLLDMDESTLEVTGVESLIEEAKREHSYLFGSVKPPTINSASPSGPVNNKPMSAADIAKLPADKKAAMWAKLMGGN